MPASPRSPTANAYVSPGAVSSPYASQAATPEPVTTPRTSSTISDDGDDRRPARGAQRWRPLACAR